MVLKLTISNITGLTLHKLSHTEMFALALDWWAYTAVFSALFDQYTWVMQRAGFTLRTEYSESEAVPEVVPKGGAPSKRHKSEKKSEKIADSYRKVKRPS